MSSAWMSVLKDDKNAKAGVDVSVAQSSTAELRLKKHRMPA